MPGVGGKMKAANTLNRDDPSLRKRRDRCDEGIAVQRAAG
jgi:hypothetical protein